MLTNDSTTLAPSFLVNLEQPVSFELNMYLLADSVPGHKVIVSTCFLFLFATPPRGPIFPKRWFLQSIQTPCDALDIPIKLTTSQPVLARKEVISTWRRVFVHALVFGPPPFAVASRDPGVAQNWVPTWMKRRLNMTKVVTIFTHHSCWAIACHSYVFKKLQMTAPDVTIKAVFPLEFWTMHECNTWCCRNPVAFELFHPVVHLKPGRTHANSPTRFLSSISFPHQPQFSSPKCLTKRWTESHHINLQVFLERAPLLYHHHIHVYWSLLIHVVLRIFEIVASGYDRLWFTEVPSSIFHRIPESKTKGMGWSVFLMSSAKSKRSWKCVLRKWPGKACHSETHEHRWSLRMVGVFFARGLSWFPTVMLDYKSFDFYVSWCCGRGSWKWIHRNRNTQSLPQSWNWKRGPPRSHHLQISCTSFPIFSLTLCRHSVGFGLARFSYKWCVSWNIQKTRWWCVQAKPSQPLGIGISESLCLSGDFVVLTPLHHLHHVQQFFIRVTQQWNS